MHQPTPEMIEQEPQGIGGWYPCTLCDGQDPVTGKHLSWLEYRHRDGRMAHVWGGGKATDPELQALLDSLSATSRLPKPELPRWLERKALIQRLVGVVKWTQRAARALAGHPSSTP